LDYKKQSFTADIDSVKRNVLNNTYNLALPQHSSSGWEFGAARISDAAASKMLHSWKHDFPYA